ncbi:MAG TPA: R2-like ligand-binding oxidase [Gaiellaceae bacterium]|nr:R2-like ligand-binding oxidase [Gaiellaceae bacterium]
MSRTAFRTTSPGGLDLDSLPMRLYQKAKRLGAWDPAAIDFSRDRELWLGLNADEQGAILQITSLFQAGEEGVTLDLLPLIMVIAEEGRLEEELFLTTFLFEEGKHVEFFRRFLDDVCGADGDLHGFHTPSYRVIFYEELPSAMSRLRDDRSREAQIRAAVTYNMIVEGVLAETGYQSYFLALERNELMPGLREGLAHVKRDESRHIAYGVHLLSRLVDGDPGLWEIAESRMSELLPHALAFIEETFAGYGPTSPFGVRLDELSEFAQGQFAKRLDRIRRGAAYEEVAL